MADPPRIPARVARSMSPRMLRLTGAAALFALTVLAYLPALKAGFIWDDDMYVTNNPALRSAEGLRDIWFKLGTTPQYYPLVFTTFWVEYHLWEKNPFGYHAVNIVLHGLAAVLLWSALRRLAIPGAWVAAAIFALHPVHVESVAWITERKNVLSGVFYFTALLCYMRFRPFEDARPDGPQRWKFYWLALLAFMAALLSKTVTASLPAAILLLLWWKRPPRRVGMRDLTPLLPMFALAAVFGTITAKLERDHVGATGADWDFTFIDRLLIAGRAVWFYFSKIVWPANLTFIYPRWEIDRTAAWQYAFPLAAVALLVVLWLLRHRIGKGPLVAALFFGGTLVPALGFVNVYPMKFSFVADHFQYLASIGPIALMTAYGVWLVQRLRASLRQVVVACALLLLATLTFIQTFVFRDVITLWTDTLVKNPTAWIARDNLSEALGNAGNFEAAAFHAIESLRLREENAVAHNNLAMSMDKLGHPDRALYHFNRSLEISPKRALVRVNLAALLLKMGDVEAAEAHYRRAVADAPAYPDAHYNLAIFLAGQNRFDEAMEECMIALQLHPASADIRTLRGYLLFKMNRTGEAVAVLQDLLRTRPERDQARLLLQHILENSPDS